MTPTGDHHVMRAADTASRTEAARACLQALRELAGGPDSAMERHCLRVFEIACESGARRGLTLDRALMTAARQRPLTVPAILVRR